MSLVGVGARLIEVASGRTLTGDELDAEVSRVAAALGELAPGVVFARIAVDLESVLHYLAAFEAGRAIALIDPALDIDVLAELVARFRPSTVLAAPDGDVIARLGRTGGPNRDRSVLVGAKPGHARLTILGLGLIVHVTKVVHRSR